MLAIHILVLMTFIFFIYDHYLTFKEYSKEQYLHQIARLQIQSNESMYHQYIEDYKKLSKLKHDIIHASSHIEDTKDLQEYLKTIDLILQPILQTYTSNKMLNQMLSLKAKEIERLDIRFEVRLWDDFLFVDPVDLILMIEELLNKAIDSQKDLEDKEISLYTSRHHLNYSLILKMNSPTKVNFDHTLIHKVLQRYDGSMYTELKDQQFIISILIKDVEMNSKI